MMIPTSKVEYGNVSQEPIYRKVLLQYSLKKKIRVREGKWLYLLTLLSHFILAFCIEFSASCVSFQLYEILEFVCQASLMAQMVKNLPAMQETLVQSLGQEDPLEEGVVTHSSILAWEIAWTEEPSRLQIIGSQRVRDTT